MLNPTTRLVDVIVAIGEADAAALTIGDQMRGTISLGKVDAIVIPRSALLRDESGDYVFTVVSDHAHRVDVEILVDRASEVAIRGDGGSGRSGGGIRRLPVDRRHAGSARSCRPIIPTGPRSTGARFCSC